jgi:hypothetical protein
MSQEIFKINFSTFQTIFHKGYSPINFLEENKEVEYNMRTRNFHTYIPLSESDDELTFVQNFANPLASVGKTDFMVVIEKKEHKLSMKIFHGSKFRARGNSWFKVSRNVEFLTLNMEKGDIYFGFLHDYQKKRKFKRRIRRNYFGSDPIQSMKSMILNLIPLDKEQRAIISEKAIRIFLNEMDGQVDSVLPHSQRLYEFYLKGKGIKYPNNYLAYFKNIGTLPQLKTLRKFDMKLVDAFMSDNKLSGDVIKKVLHVVNNVQTNLINSALKTFPIGLILQDAELVKELFEGEYGYRSFSFNSNGMSKKEIRNVLTCFRESIVDGEIGFWSWNDHCEMYSYLKNMGENIKWTSSDYKTFREEHLDWTDKCEFYKKGYYRRTYPDSLYEAFKEPLIYGDNKLYPIVLKESDDYNEESKTQQNCVKTYIGRPSSIIVSLRKNSTTSDERATVEYQIFKKDEIIMFNRPQSLGRFNSRLDETWTPILHLLDERITKWTKLKDNLATVKLEKELTNGQKLHSDSEWSENGFLVWTYNVINKSSPFTGNNPFNFFI